MSRDHCRLHQHFCSISKTKSIYFTAFFTMFVLAAAVVVVLLGSVLLSEAKSLTLVNSAIVSRHGVRSPYPPTNSTSASDVSMYSGRPFPTWQDWGYSTEKEYADQDLTPHGQRILPYVGSYYRQLYSNLSLDIGCDKVWCYADFTSGNSTRDVETARLWLEGFNCTETETEVRIVTTTNENKGMAPVLSDHFDNGCPLPTEDQIDGLWGGDVNALTDMYADGITAVQDVLRMPANATICENVNPDFDKSAAACTLFETGYEFTGLYFQGEFLSPLYYAQYFAETWMLQFVSNITNWAFNELTLSELTDLYNMHIKTLSFGMNLWTSKAYSSQQLAYIVATLAQKVEDANLDGVYQPKSNNLLLLVSHDTNILYLGTLLNLNWIPLGYGNNVASTSGALIFELYEDQEASGSDEKFYVKVHYDAASPTQQRNAEILTLDNPPSIANLVIPECGSEYCPWNRFVQVAIGSINLDCIQEPLRSTVASIYNGNDDGDDTIFSDTTITIETISACIGAGVLIFAVSLYFCNKHQTNSNKNMDTSLYTPLQSDSQFTSNNPVHSAIDVESDSNSKMAVPSNSSNTNELLSSAIRDSSL